MDLRSWGRLVRRLQLELKVQKWNKNEVAGVALLCLQNMLDNCAYESID
jgi:hypothetical protein